MIKFITALLLLSLLSCSLDNRNEYPIGAYNLLIEIPESFIESDSISIDNWYIEARKVSEDYNYTEFNNYKSIFFFKSGEFTLYKAVTVEIDENLDKTSFIKQWRKGNSVAFSNSLAGLGDNSEITIDSLSSIQIISDTEFYVFEITIRLYAENGVPLKFNTLAYSTIIGDEKLVINATFLDQSDGESIKNSLRNIIIKNK